MRCDNCGRAIQNEEANFCEYCGSSFREQRQAPFHKTSNEDVRMNNTRAIYPNRPMTLMNQPARPMTENQEQPGSFLSWLGLYGLLLIPFVGWLVFIVIAFLWAFGGNASATKKNWARATLVFVGVLIILFIILTAVMMFLYQPMYQEMYEMMENGTFNYDTYMELLKKYY